MNHDPVTVLGVFVQLSSQIGTRPLYFRSAIFDSNNSATYECSELTMFEVFCTAFYSFQSKMDRSAKRSRRP